MKTRISNNRIRLRLTKTDIAQLKERQSVECKTVISNQEVFRYTLASKRELDLMKATFEESRIKVMIPSALASKLTDTPQIGIKGWQDNGAEEKLFILIEKDLKYLDESREDQSDVYDHSEKAC